MQAFQSTPPRIVEGKDVAAYGLFDAPFRTLNLLDVALPGVPRPLRKFRLKEWQHFAVIAGDWVLVFVVLNAHYMADTFCYLVDRTTGRLIEHHRATFSGAAQIARELWHASTRFERPGYRIVIDNRLEEARHHVHIDIADHGATPGITADFELLEDLAAYQPLIAVLPINDPRRPLYTHKNVCPVRGWLRVCDRRIDFDPDHDLVLIDVQKTYYPYRTFWKWAAFAGYTADGHCVGLNVVENLIKDDDVHNENGLWVDGRFSPWGAVRFFFDESDLSAPWIIETVAGIDQLVFTPEGERAGKINTGLVMSDYHQPYGTFSGVVTDVDGVIYEIDEVVGVTEHHVARF